MENAVLREDSLICIASDTLFEGRRGQALTSQMGERGIRLELFSGHVRQAETVTAVILDTADHAADAPLAVWARQHECPIVAVSKNWSGRGWRLGEWTAGSAWGEDFRLKRLVDRFGRKLDLDAIDAYASASPPPGSDWRPGGSSPHPGVTLALDPLLPAEWKQALGSPATRRLAASLGVFLTDNTATTGSALMANGASAVAWEALARGRELVCVAQCPFAHLGISHDAPSPAHLADALRSVAAGRRNRRDVTRMVLAVEGAFNTVSDDPASIASALDGAIRAVSLRPRQTVSIVITCYNYADFVGAAIASALRQTIPAHQIIVVDDGSTDGSDDVIRAAYGIDAVFKENGGQASAFNAGFVRATGDLVLFLDADDRLNPDAVERLGLADTRGFSRVQFGLETIDAAGRSTGLYQTRRRPANGHLLGALLADGIFSFMPTSGNAFPRRSLDPLMPIPKEGWRICADLYLVLASATQGDTTEVDGVLGQYRVHGRNGYFRMLGSEPYLDVAKRRQHRRAWRDVAATLDRHPVRARADRIRLALDRLALATDVERPAMARLAEAFRAARNAASAHTVPAGERFGHAASAFRQFVWPGGARRQSAPGDDLSPSHLIERAGRTTWPLMGPSDQDDMHAAMTRRGLFGHGWSEPTADGVCLDEADAFLGFRIPRTDTHWRLRLDFTVIGTAPVRGIEIRLNGTVIDELDLAVRGVIDLRLPVELLADWSSLASVPGDLAACVSFHAAQSDVGRLHVLPIALDVLTDMRPSAPLLSEGGVRHLQSVRATEDDTRAAWLSDGCLGHGWRWGDESGVMLADASGRLHISIPPKDRHALTFVLGADPGVDLSECLQISANGMLVAHHSSPDRRSFTVMVPTDSVEADGRLSIELAAFSEPATGNWPLICLAGLRFDKLDAIGGVPRLVPNIRVQGGPFVQNHSQSMDGMACDAESARILSDGFGMDLDFPAVGEHAALQVRIVAATPLASPVAACLTLDGRCYDFWFGRDNLVSLPLHAGPSRAIPLRGHIEANDRSFALASLQLSASEGRSPVANVQHGPVVDHMGPIFGTTVPLLDENLLAWHHPVDGVAWMAVHGASLLLPPLPDGVHALDVTVLTIGEPKQRMSITLGSSRASTDKAGLQVLRVELPRQVTGERLRLDLSCDRLISAAAMGATGPGMLGGGIREIALVAGEHFPAPSPAARITKPRRMSRRQTGSLP